METVIEVSDLCKFYAGVAAVDGVSLSVGRGEVFGVLGPNGAGKTTAVECVAGLRRPPIQAVEAASQLTRYQLTLRQSGLARSNRTASPEGGSHPRSVRSPSGWSSVTSTSSLTNMESHGSSLSWTVTSTVTADAVSSTSTGWRRLHGRPTATLRWSELPSGGDVSTHSAGTSVGKRPHEVSRHADNKDAVTQRSRLTMVPLWLVVQ